MARTVRVGRVEYVRDRFPHEFNYAFDAYEKIGAVSWKELGPNIRLGSFIQPLTESRSDLGKPCNLLFSLGVAFDPRSLDEAPRVDCAFGTLPVAEDLLKPKLAELNTVWRGPAGPQAERAGKLLAATAQVFEHLASVFDAYRLRCDLIWRAMQEAEWIATDYYYAHLARNRMLARRERDRYLYPRRPGPIVLRAESADVKGLRVGLAAINRVRKSAHVDDVKREQVVVTGVALGLGAATILNQLQNGRIYPSQQDQEQLNKVTGLLTQAAKNTAEAMQEYLEAIRVHGEQYPLLSILGPREIGSYDYGPFAEAIDTAVKDVIAACEKLMQEGARHLVIPEAPSLHSMTPGRLAQTIADAPAVSVWKLPFFLERALQQLPTERAEDAEKVMALAAELDGSQCIRSALAISGVETGLMVAAATGPIGATIAFQWAVVQVIKSVHEYGEMKALFEASIDPRLFLRGLDHEPASRLSVFLSLLGLIV